MMALLAWTRNIKRDGPFWTKGNDVLKALRKLLKILAIFCVAEPVRLSNLKGRSNLCASGWTEVGSTEARHAEIGLSLPTDLFFVEEEVNLKFLLLSLLDLLIVPRTLELCKSTWDSSIYYQLKLHKWIWLKCMHCKDCLPRWPSGKEWACQCRRRGFDLWVGKIPWSRK